MVVAFREVAADVVHERIMFIPCAGQIILSFKCMFLLVYLSANG